MGSSRGTPDSPPSVNNYPITRAKDVTEKQQRAIIHKKNRPETAAFPKTCVRFSGILLRIAEGPLVNGEKLLLRYRGRVC
jgi:hypothetical protein